ncbi:MAG: hypothetical protein H8K07_18220 [Nitrospira sp.]|nr:hypothetical protein [Nitrospira sp.]MDI3465533.1 hypothetical protein [Nitrospira sp.]
MESIGTSLAETRRGFLFGTIMIFVMTFAWLGLAGSLGISQWTEYLLIIGILAQVLLIHRREQALYTSSRRWRFWYALIIAGFACDLMTRHLWMQGHDTFADPTQVRGQLLLGGLLLFYVMVFPITLRLTTRNKTS